MNMNIHIEVDSKIEEEEIIIRCKEINDEVLRIESLLTSVASKKTHIMFYKKEQEYYLPLSDILFFETEGHTMTAHTINEVYYVKYKLYELEAILPDAFIRVSKSTIVNINKIYSILRDITSSSKVEFRHTHKKIYVSRNYYKNLKSRLMEKRN